MPVLAVHRTRHAGALQPALEGPRPRRQSRYMYRLPGALPATRVLGTGVSATRREQPAMSAAPPHAALAGASRAPPAVCGRDPSESWLAVVAYV